MAVQAKARLRYVSIPPRKMRLVADMIKGMPVEDALDQLNFTNRIAARHVAKTLKSAAANALSQAGTSQLNPEDLYVKHVTVDAAPTLKRIRFQSMGRAFRIRKRQCHLTIILEQTEASEVEQFETAEAPKKKAAAKKTTKKKTARKKKTATKKKSAAKKKTATKKKSATKKTATKKSASKSTAKKTTKKKTATKKSEDK